MRFYQAQRYSKHRFKSILNILQLITSEHKVPMTYENKMPDQTYRHCNCTTSVRDSIAPHVCITDNVIQPEKYAD